MLELHEQCTVPRSPTAVFNYLADFSSAAEWDPTTLSARRLDSGPPRVGSRFELNCALPLGSIRVTYRLTHLEAGRCLRLSGSSRLFDVDDEIILHPENDGCLIDYRASFRFPAAIERYLQQHPEKFVAMGQRTMEGLEEALSDDNAAPVPRADTECADRWLLPGIAHFTRYGYQRGKKRWKPCSTDISGRHMIITGATSGLGEAAARSLAEAGAALTLVVRDQSRGKDLVESLQAASGNSDIHLELADLSLLQAVDDLCARLLQRGRPIDALINNAGALFNDKTITAEGMEQSYALLLLSPWRLTTALQPLLVQSGDARVVNVVSGGMYTQRLDLRCLTGQSEHYNGSVAYAQAKRALMIATEYLADEWRDHGIVVNAMHPGWADTPGVASALPAFRRLTAPLLRSPEQGADTMVWLARAREAGLVSGRLFLDREPRTTHLLKRTEESAEERTALLELLSEYRPG
ncbi:SDR family NAD(P)-dependent oxidoreductase [Parahaliea aestuarii]|uniref:SDR family NAD(P)-dependent oxidoreductase n=1 Tax=Parahaliea aestuarii TaxID=1852021 RepID=A0A5C8ZXU6_9GAMM|nr:SDR family NAD(P)-dependent oxidoreductase [Parahaliea aestuarii]TXS93306.1 SDR family NAD(P)-dependent oxidoreductase [Parahaliea aestuarii]